MTSVPNPFEVLPELIWENIIREKLENSTDLCNLFQAFPQLSGIIDKCEALFSKVLPLLFLDLEKEELLTCREVCKWWKRSVDKFLETHPSTCPYNGLTYFETAFDYRYRSLYTSYKSSMMSLIKVPKGYRRMIKVSKSLSQHCHKDASFVGRSVAFWFDGYFKSDWITINKFYRIAGKLLSEFGAGIWHTYLPLTSGTYRCDETDRFEQFIRCLYKVRNLRSLCVGMPYNCSYRTSSERFSEQFELELRNIAVKLPLPNLPHLHSLRIIPNEQFLDKNEFYPLEEVYRILISKYSPQLQSVTMGLQYWRDEYGSRLGSLTEFIIENVNGTTISFLPRLIESLNAPHLEMLGIINLNLNMKRFLETIQHWPIIKILTINVCMMGWFRCQHDTLPTLPNIIALTLQNSHVHEDLPSLYILKSFPSLEYLEICKGAGYTGIPQREESDCLKLDASRAEIIVLWKLFPKLKMLALGNVKQTRDMFNAEEISSKKGFSPKELQIIFKERNMWNH